MALDGGKAANTLLYLEQYALIPLLANSPLASHGVYDLQIIYVAEYQAKQTVNLLGPTGIEHDTGHYDHPLYIKQAEDVGRAIERISRRENIVGVGYRITIRGRVFDLIFSLEEPK